MKKDMQKVLAMVMATAMVFISLITGTGIIALAQNHHAEDGTRERGTSTDIPGSMERISRLATETDSGTCGPNLTWRLDVDGVLTISGTGVMDNYIVLPVPWISYRSDITSVVIEDGVISIGDSAFYGCTNARSIDLGNGVQTIGKLAFWGCNSLGSITIKSNIQAMDDMAFAYCSSLSEINFMRSTPPMFNLTCFNNVAYSGILRYPEGAASAYANILSNTGLTVGWTSNPLSHSGMCGDNLYWELDNITRTLRIFGTGMMYDYSAISPLPGWQSYQSNIRTVIVEDGATRIGSWALHNCANLTSVEMADSVKVIAENAFRSCSNLSTVTLGNRVETIGDYAFYAATRLAAVAFPESVQTIGNYAFAYCKAIEDIVIPDGVQRIGENAFDSCDALRSISLGNGALDFDYAFMNIPNLINLTLKDGIQAIGEGSFASCTALEAITIPASVQAIDWAAFGNCTSLNEITFLSNTPPATINSGSFDGVTANGVIHYPSSSVGGYTPAWRDAIDGLITWFLNPYDTTAPILTVGAVERSSDTMATITFSSDEAGIYYYQMDGSAPTANELVIAGTNTSMMIADTMTVHLTSLTAGGHTLYVASKDMAGNVSNLLTITIPAFVMPTAQTPVITGISGEGTYWKDTTVVLTVSVEPVTDGGTLSYQWFSNNVDGNNGAVPVGSNEASYTPDSSALGTMYYYCVVTNTNGAASAASISGTVAVTIQLPGDNPSGPGKTDASISRITAVFDKYVHGQEHKEITITLDLGSYALNEILCDGTTLVMGADYTVNGDQYTFPIDILKTLADGEHTIVFLMTGSLNPSLSLIIQDTSPDKTDIGNVGGEKYSNNDATAKTHVADTPETGDDTNLMFYAILGIISLASIVVLLLVWRQMQKHKSI